MSKQLTKGIIILVFSMVVTNCSLLKYDHVTPALEDLSNYEIVFFDYEENKVRFATVEGEKSQGYEFKVLTPGLNKQKYNSGIMSMLTWSQDGKYLLFLSRPYNPNGMPVMYDIDSGKYVKCDLEDLPQSQSRVWSIGDKKVITVDDREEDDRVVTLDFETCRIEVLYKAKTKENISEKILEAIISSTGWLAITRYWDSSMDIYDILIISPEGEEYVIENAGFPAWSKDGEQLAFIIQGKGLFVSDETGFNITPIDLGIDLDLYKLGTDFVSWSPDGNNLMYSYRNDIYIYDFETSSKRLFIEEGIYPNWRWNAP